MASESVYDTSFFDRREATARRSADRVVPVLLEFVQATSVVDVGCGLGAWLAAFQRCGVREILGVDGDYVDRAKLAIPPDRFVAANLEQPIVVDARFDLAVSLEVAEHLEEEAARPFVSSLTALAPVVFFSAAIPGQDGKNHKNEQWPGYWTRLFEERGYVPVDCIRSVLWSDPEVAYWYAQNALVYVEQSRLPNYPLLAAERERRPPVPPRLVHPELYLKESWPGQIDRVAREVLAFIDAESTVIVVDDDNGLREALAQSLSTDRTLPFLERDGIHYGCPEDDATAIAELGRMRAAGARYVVFAYPNLWWLGTYPGLRDHLFAESGRRHESESVLVFDLKS